MKPFSTIWKTIIASMFVASAVLVAGCDSQSDGNGQTTPEVENSTGEPADVTIDTPGLNIQINKEKDSAEVDVDVPDDQSSKKVDIDVNSPE